MKITVEKTEDSYLLKVYNRIIRGLIWSQSVKQIGPQSWWSVLSRLIYDGLWSEADPRNLCYLICRHPLYNCPPTDHVSTQGQGTALPPSQLQFLWPWSVLWNSLDFSHAWFSCQDIYHLKYVSKGLNLCLCFEVCCCWMTLGNGDLPDLLYYWYTCECMVTLSTTWHWPTLTLNLKS